MNSVAVLLCTFRGAQYLPRQLDSIAAQTHRDWHVYVSDDGSDDDTQRVLDGYRERWGEARLSVFRGPGQGFSKNFFSLLERPEVDAEFIAFCDQDDEWHAHKLARAIKALSGLAASTPGLYGSRSQLVDSTGNHLGFSRLFRKPPGFANALVQNMVSGNTMVLNRAALQLVRSNRVDLAFSAHDWWTYLLVTGAGGVMFYDPETTIAYRQHGHNLYGENRSPKAMLRRVRKLFAGNFKEWNEVNVEGLRRCWDQLTEDSRRQVELFERARRGSLPRRIFYLARSGVYRQTWDGQLGLLVAAAMNRI